ncbi:MAG: malonyl-ACP O-methyltransferase BioC [Neisseriaceae bacterium]|nr:malonyl-ACP O-methyltransferase BioC [Neisseriaceae bacterium]MBP6861884.1 malonyl-ACP O-methyltransferase BioC [Neisseriaceae bacterium]
MWPKPNPNPLYDKQAIGQAFGRAAHTYDAHAALQRCVGDRVNQLLGQAQQPYGGLLDVGCGTGYIARHWRAAGAPVWALDLSVAMLAQARAHHSADGYVQGDAERLPFADQCFATCSSNLALQWCADLRVPLGELYRVLAPQGRAVFSTLVAGSLSELNQAWACVDDRRHVNEFLSLSQLQGAMAAVGADRHEWHTATHTMWYPSVWAMMKDLKGIGATHVHGARRQGLLSRGQLAALEAALRPHQNQQGLLPLSYDVFYGVLQRD